MMITFSGRRRGGVLHVVHGVLDLFVISGGGVFNRRRPLKRGPAAGEQMSLHVRRLAKGFPAFRARMTTLTFGQIGLDSFF